MEDEFNRDWIIRNARVILKEYSEGITVRQLHYRLVAIGMTNDINHYKRVVAAMTKARWEQIVDMDAFIDRERTMYGSTEADEKELSSEIETAKRQIKAWMENYSLERWSNQKNYVEVGIEKKALQGVFERPCFLESVGLAPCKGYPSITFLYEMAQRFKRAMANGKQPIFLYFGDYDPSGEDIPRSIEENLNRLGIPIIVKRIALTPEQIAEMNLPGVPPKHTDTRTINWDGEAVVELDAVEPKTLSKMCREAIQELFDQELYNELQTKENEEEEQYRAALKDFVNSLGADTNDS